MVSDQQVKRLWRLTGQKWALEIAAAKAGMDPKTAQVPARSAAAQRDATKAYVADAA